jgi:hypothetical protein
MEKQMPLFNFWGRSKQVCSILVIPVALVGCSQFYEPKPQLTHLTREAVLSNTSSLTHTFVVDRKTSFVTCTAPQPDSSFSQSASEAFSISFMNFGGNDKEGVTQGSEGVELSGRTPSVLMARELFFRACEFSRNNELNKAEAIKLYEKTLDVVNQGWRVESGNTRVKIGEIDTKTISQTVTAEAPTEMITGAGTKATNQRSPGENSGGQENQDTNSEQVEDTFEEQ